jgi:acyl transferase domain-containing protein
VIDPILASTRSHDFSYETNQPIISNGGLNSPTRKKSQKTSMMNGNVPNGSATGSKHEVESVAGSRPTKQATATDVVTHTNTGHVETSRLTLKSLDSLAYTLSRRRTFMEWRAFALVSSSDSLDSLENLISKPLRAVAEQNIGYIFTGQGAQYAGMGMELCCYPVFEQTLRALNSVFSTFGSSWDLFGK